LLVLAAAAPDPKPSDPKISTLTTALAQARGPTQAMQIEIELEARRLQTVQPAVRLLQRRSQRELASGDRRAAVSDLDDAVSLQPDNALLWRERGAARAANGDLEGAIADLGGALSRDPADVLAWQSLAAVEQDRSSWMAAYKAWQHVLSLDPQVHDGSKRLDLLRRRAFGQPA